MARTDEPHHDPAALREQLEQLKEVAATASPQELWAVIEQMMASAPGAVDLLERPSPPSRRRPRRSDVVTYRVRIDLRGAKPPLWRRLELASDLRLDEVHDVIQVAFGWLDGHLHRFGSGPAYYSHETEYYLCEWEVEEGEADGVPEHEVRLDEVLVDVGDKLFYAYDYGDDWQHVIELEAVEPRADDAPRAVCVKGRRPGPPEDCGGVHMYELIVAATDLTDPDHAEAKAEVTRRYGGDVDSDLIRPTPFDIDLVNELLAGTVDDRRRTG